MSAKRTAGMRSGHLAPADSDEVGAGVSLEAGNAAWLTQMGPHQRISGEGREKAAVPSAGGSPARIGEDRYTLSQVRNGPAAARQSVTTFL